MANIDQPDNRGKGPTVTPPPPGGPRRPKWLLWAALAVALLLLLLLFRSCGDRQDAVTTSEIRPADTAATMPAATAGAASSPVAGDLNSLLAQYLASSEPAGRRFTFDALHFATSSAQLPADANTSLTGLAQVLNQHPQARVQVVGYADARGGEGANTELGAQRAEAVARALIGMGVAADRITSASGSETNPVAPNSDPQGQAANRRTELVVTSK